MLIRPIQTEKAFAQATKNTYIFLTPAKASKQAIKAAVEEEHKVSVVSVRTLTRKGKPTRFSRGKRAYPGTTYRQDKHFAYVTLKDGDKIKVFDEEPAKDAKATATKAAVNTTDEKQNEETKKIGFFAKRRTGRRGDK
jgi:ribosomal protein L23